MQVLTRFVYKYCTCFAIETAFVSDTPESDTYSKIVIKRFLNRFISSCVTMPHTSRADEALKRKSQQALQSGAVECPIETLRLQCLSRGSAGIMGLGR